MSRTRKPDGLVPSLLQAIINDDDACVRRMLRADPDLARGRLFEVGEYATRLAHWIYAGDSALHAAAAGHRVQIVDTLLAAGAEPDSAHNHRRSRPLHYACDGLITAESWRPEPQTATIRLLLGAGAEVNAQDMNGATPLHRAVRTRCAAAVMCLLDAGADPCLVNKPGSTPFHLAVQNTGRGGSGTQKAKDAQGEIVRLFMARGVGQDLKDGKGHSVLECARSAWIRDLLSGGGSL